MSTATHSTPAADHSVCFICEAIRSTIATKGWEVAERYHSNKAGHAAITEVAHAERLLIKLTREAEATYAEWADREASMTEAQRKEQTRKVRQLERAIRGTNPIVNATARRHWEAKTNGRDGTVIIEHKTATGAVVRTKMAGPAPAVATTRNAPVPTIEEALAAMSTSTIHNGTYTITGPRGRRTFKVSTAQNGTLKGKRIIAVLNGPDNESDYLGVAFLTNEDTAAVWRKHQGTQWETLARAFVQIMLKGMEGYAVDASNTCRRCNRRLTVPTSIHNGLGPECAGKAA